jgi:8-oxo-dGTP pyrophosphatase MutT (NUDIX family)
MNRQPKNISYGIIIYKSIDNIPYYCLICRKDSFTFNEFIRGKYQLEDVDAIYRMISYMTETEKQVITNSNFDIIWNTLWTLDKRKIGSHHFKKDYNQAKYKFETLKRGYYTTIHTDLAIKEKRFMKLEDIVKDIETKNYPKYTEPEWGFPKGKKNRNESKIDCAKREVLEETNISMDDLTFHNDDVYEEKFVADNLVEYIHIYYLAKCNPNKELKYDENNLHQYTEISNIEWFTYDQCINKIRSYNKEKRDLLTIVNNYVTSLAC